MTIPTQPQNGKVKSHYVEDPAELLQGNDDDYIPHFTNFLAKRYKSSAPADYENMARVLISRRRDPQGVQNDYGDAGAQGIDDLVAFAKKFKPKKLVTKTATIKHPDDRIMKTFLRGSGIQDSEVPKWIAILNDDYAVGENILKGTPEYDQTQSLKEQYARYKAGRGIR